MKKQDIINNKELNNTIMDIQANPRYFSITPESIGIDGKNQFAVADAKWFTSEDGTFKHLAVKINTAINGSRWLHIYDDLELFTDAAEYIKSHYKKETITISLINLYFYPYSCGGRGISLRSCGVFIIK